MRRFLLMLATAVLVSCGSSPLYYTRVKPLYVSCGSTMCVVGYRDRPKIFSLDFMGDTTVTSRSYVRLRGLHAREFRKIGAEGWVTDGRQVWCGYPDPIAPFSAFRDLGSGFYAVSGTVHKGCVPVSTTRVPNPIAAESLDVLGCGLVRHGGAIYSAPPGSGEDLVILHAIGMVDGPTFTVDPGCEAAHDVRFDYTLHSNLPRDPRPRGPRPRGQRRPDLPCNYTRVDGAVYFHTTLVEGADAATFEVLGDECDPPMARDRGNVYSMRQRIAGADPATFQILDRYSGTVVARDRSSVYFRGRRLEGPDAPTFTRVVARNDCRRQRQYHYFADANHVYVFERPLQGADLATFQLVEPDPTLPCTGTGEYAKDAHSVWWGDEQIDGADPSTFVVDSAGNATDRNGRYVRHQLEPGPARRP
jgi:hypothetical protein